MSESERQIVEESEGGASQAGIRARRRWPRWLGMVLLGLVILGSGIVVGSVGTLIVVRRGIVEAVQQPEQIPERTAERMARRYDLSDRQRAEVNAILRQRLQRMAAIRQRLRPHLDAELDSLREDVAEVLTDEQETEWRADFNRLRDAVQVPMYAPAEPPDEQTEGAPPG